jgi:opacity protein-like surface antigen
MRVSHVVLAGIATLAVPTATLAQQKGDAGVTMGYPGAIGVIYHVTDRFAIRPEITFAISSGKSESPFSTSEGDTSTVGIGVSGIFYLKQADKLRTYVSPRYTYSHSESTTTSSILSPILDDEESTATNNAHTLTGTFGVQYALHERFNIFGEVGAGFARTRSKSELSGFSSSSNQFSSRTGVGVIFYF